MKDLYSFHVNEEDLEKYYEKTQAAYKKIFDRCGIGDKTFLTFASGGTFSKYSHEFQTLTEAGEDLVYICKKCKVAVNKEILQDQHNKCPQCGKGDLEEKKAVEVGNIFKLGTKFSKPFELFYKDQSGESKLVVMGCYGIGVQRLMGTIVEVLHDEHGIIWPQEVAPFKVHLIELASGNEKVSKAAQELYGKLRALNIEVLFDDRADVAAGEKFADADLIGCPCRVVVSQKTIEGGGPELKMRKEKESRIVPEDELISLLSNPVIK